MHIVTTPKEHVFVQLSNTDTQFLWQAANYVRDAFSAEEFKDRFEMSPKHASDLCRTLSEALDAANGTSMPTRPA